MQVLKWFFISIIFLWSGSSLYGTELYAQRTPIRPDSVVGQNSSSVPEQEESICLDFETNTSSNCEPEFNVEIEVEPEPIASTPDDPPTDDSTEEVTIILNPEISFVDDYLVNLDSKKPRDTIIYGGVVPFVALPDGELANEDSFFNEESFSVFFYLKRKF